MCFGLINVRGRLFYNGCLSFGIVGESLSTFFSVMIELCEFFLQKLYDHVNCRFLLCIVDGDFVIIDVKFM